MIPNVESVVSSRNALCCPIHNDYEIRQVSSSRIVWKSTKMLEMRRSRSSRSDRLLRLSCNSMNEGNTSADSIESDKQILLRLRSTNESIEKMNNIPHTRELRRHFYEEVSDGVMAALADGCLRMSIQCIIPELNTELDVYRVGTLLEMTRSIAARIASNDKNKKVKVCVQQPLGSGVFQGMPLSLNGVMRIMQQMQWYDNEEQIKLGNIGANEVDDADAFIIISPQNITGYSVLPLLEEMVKAAEEQSKPLIILNAKLRDVPSSAGVMGVRGRQERLDFISTFKTVYHFRLLFLGASIYPIMGALQYSWGKTWQVFRRDDITSDAGLRKEEYRLIGNFEEEPDASKITDCFQRSR